MIIKNVKFSYAVKTYHVGPYVDFISELEVPSWTTIALSMRLWKHVLSMNK